MTDKQSSPKTAKTLGTKKTGGGTAVGGGVNFQAAATAIVGVHILRGATLGWLEGLCSDKPSGVWAESEGAGDDLRIELGDSLSVEVQAKKGLARGPNLWTALHSIAEAINKGLLSYGVLAVASDSSRTIREDLAIDIERLGQGRTDSLTKIGADWYGQLAKANIPFQKVCRCLRIKVIHALSADDSSISAAKEMLRHICARVEDADAAWNCLYRQAVLLIEKRGRWTLQDLILLLRSSKIAIREDDFPASVFDRYRQWVINTNNHFSITGIKRKVPLAHLLPMHLKKFEHTSQQDASSALEHYHNSIERNLFSEEFDSVWTARFKRLVVVVAGPGLGKSTMIRELAHQYAQDGFFVLRVTLKPIAAAMKAGAAFSDLLLQHALDGSPISLDQIQGKDWSSWVVLADGLDECGSFHDKVATQISNYSLGHPGVRVVVTTRPIGYDTAALSNWTHYSLLPPRKEDGAENLKRLVCGVMEGNPTGSGAQDSSLCQLEIRPPSDAISISPQLLGMAASLIYHRRNLPDSRLELYGQLIKLFERVAADSSAQADFNEAVLDTVGWILIKNPLILFDELIGRAAKKLSPMMGKAPLALKGDIRQAIAHWEGVGLVEKIYHQSSVLLTFIHKTFCEFVASRFLIREPENLSEDVVDNSEMQEVLSFAVGQGLGDKVIEFYLCRHAEGLPKQLTQALALLGHKEIAVSNWCAQALIRKSFKAVEDEVSDKFSVGVALANLGERANYLVSSLVESNLAADNPAVRLVAWAVAIKCDASPYDASTLSNVLAELLSNAKPFDIREILENKDRSDRELLQMIGLAALKAQPSDRARAYAEIELENKKLQSVMFRFQVNEILKSRGIEELPSLFQNEKKVFPSATLSYAGPSYKSASTFALRSIASAFTAGYFDSGAVPNSRCGLPQFAGLIHASGFLQMPAGDIYTWMDAHDELAVHSTIRVVAQLTSLDMRTLAEESKEVLFRLDTGRFDSMLNFLPVVDIDQPIWSRCESLTIDRDEIKRALVHSAVWIRYLAANIGLHIEMTLDELEELLGIAKGESLRNIIFLIRFYYPEDESEALLRRLSKDASDDVSSIFKTLRELGVSPSNELMSTTLACLLSDDENSAESAAELLSHWFDQGIVIDEELVAKALERWGGYNSQARFTLCRTPAYSIQALLDKINITE